MRLLSLALLVLGALALRPPLASAQSNAELVATGHDTRSHDYDLVHQRIELRNIDWDSLSLDGRVTTTLVALRPGFDSVVLDASHRIAVRAATDARGRALRAEPHGDSLVVHLARAAGYGDTVRFTLDYHATIANGKGLTFIQADGRPHRPRQLWSMGEPYDNSAWFPTYDFPNDKMTWEMIVTVPRAMTPVSNGRLVSDVRHRDGTHTVHWSQEQPSATYLVSLSIAPYVRIRDRWRGIPVDYYVYREDSAKARRVFGFTPDIMETYTRLTHVPYPWAKYAQVTVADFFGGEEMVSATELVDWLPDERAYVDRPWYQQVLIPHELAHQWFGDFVTTANWANVWINEGFAEFMNGAYWEAKLGRRASDDFYLDEYQQYLAIDAARTMPLASLGSNNIYPKGALVLRMLRRYLGEERFWASVHRFLEQRRYAPAITEDFRSAVLEATGENLDWFWNQWMYQAGHPAISVTSVYDSTAHALTLAVRQTQGDSLPLDTAHVPYTIPASFRMPLAIRVGTARGDTVVHTWLDGRTQSIRVDRLAGAPTMVVFDDGNRILKTLDFPQPTAWLATMLSRDEDLWNRWWAIGQLGRRVDDPDAARALAKAATGADWFATRAQAAGALAAFPAPLSAPALDVAAHDTSSAVRKAAIAALALQGSAHALDVSRAAFEKDTSYEVRATALAALVRLDSAGRRDVIARALRTPSYRDVIQSAAFDAIARLADTSFVAIVDSMAGEQIRATYTLGTLAARGDARALDLLTARLDDERPYVREWALGAFRRRVGAVGAQRLREVVSSLRHSDARRGAEDVLGDFAKTGGGTR